MRNMLILLAIAAVAASSTGCSSCRGLFRRGAPCGGTAIAATPTLGGAIPLGNPVAVRPSPQPAQIVRPAPTVIAQPSYNCQPACVCPPRCVCPQPAPVCCQPCPTECVPCDTGYIGGDCGCENLAPGEYFGGYEGLAPPVSGDGFVPQNSGDFPRPTN